MEGIEDANNGHAGRYTPTQERILAILERAGDRLTGKQIMMELERQFGPVGVSTVKGALGELVRHGAPDESAGCPAARLWPGAMEPARV